MEVRTELFGELEEGWDSEVWHEEGWVAEEGGDGEVEGWDIGV